MLKMIALRLTLLLILANEIISEEVIKNGTEVVLPEPKNAFKFEGQSDTPQSYGLIRFEDQNKYSSNNGDINNEFHVQHNVLDNKGQRIKFEEENIIQNQRPNHQKKKRRRRKPKQILPNGAPSFQNGGVPGSFGRPGPVYPIPIYPGQRYPPFYPGQMYKPRPSPTSAALSAVTEALTSIALYDDRQCVPRMLCEAAGGATGVGGAAAGTASGLLQSITGLQPLLTLLAAYNGISSSPLFVFGRAVFLGMTSKSNPGTCRYAYPDCPNDPEQLVHYLNNHNGGFFRFFAAPELNQQQGLEQFYNQLSGQSYGYYQPQQNLGQVGYGQLQQQNYQNQNLQQQGVYQNQNLQQGVYQNLQQVGYGQLQQPNFPNYNPTQQNLYQNSPQGYGQHPNNQNFGHQRPNPYGNSYGLYGKAYPYQQNVKMNRLTNNEIQKRIQNLKNTEFYDNNVGNSKWMFPESTFGNAKGEYNNVRIGKVLKFPGNNVNSVSKSEGFVFPGIQSNREYLVNNIEAEPDDIKFDEAMREHYYRNENQYIYGGNSHNYDDNNNVRTLYIVRGNGDPNHPEIVHLAPGQTL